MKLWTFGVLVLLVGCGEESVQVERGAPPVVNVPLPEAEPEPQGRLIRHGHYSLVWLPHTPEPPDPMLDTEAKAVLAKHSGTLKWHSDAPEGGQWEYRPKSECGWGLDQFDHSASIAVILAGTDADAMCEICGERKNGKWVNPGPPPKYEGCNDEEWAQVEDVVRQTEKRLGKVGVL